MTSVASKICVALLLLVPFSICSQDTEKAKAYFSKYMNTSAINALIAKSLPTKEDCKIVFKGEDADISYTYIEQLKNTSADQENPVTNENFVDISFQTFTTEDVLNQKGNYAGGMASLGDKLQPGIVFYKLELLREAGAEYGMAYKYWVNLKGRWVYFPKPWRAFKTSSK